MAAKQQQQQQFELDKEETLPYLKKLNDTLSNKIVLIRVINIDEAKIAPKELASFSLGEILGKLVSEPKRRIDELLSITMNYEKEFLEFSENLLLWLPHDIRLQQLERHGKEMRRKRLMRNYIVIKKQ